MDELPCAQELRQLLREDLKDYLTKLEIRIRVRIAILIALMFFNLILLSIVGTTMLLHIYYTGMIE